MTVVIAGAGPTGLTLAIELARRGVPCRVLEKAAALFPGSRGKGLQPRTLEVFDDLGVIGAVLAAGESFPPMRLYRGADVVWEKPIYELLGLPELVPSPAVPYPYTWLIPQWRTDQILAARFTELGGTIEFDTEVTGFTQGRRGRHGAYPARIDPRRLPGRRRRWSQHGPQGVRGGLPRWCAHRGTDHRG